MSSNLSLPKTGRRFDQENCIHDGYEAKWEIRIPIGDLILNRRRFSLCRVLPAVVVVAMRIAD